MTNCLVIGGGGFIGSHLAPQLALSGRQVTIIDKAPQNDASTENVTFIEGDYSDTELIRSLLDCHDDVVQLAYATVPNTSFEDPLADLLQNLPPMLQLFSEIALRGRRLVLVSSGGAVYGEAVDLPITEGHPTTPISPYGVTKLTLEKYAHLYSVTHGLKVMTVRPANAYGEGQRPFAGQGFIATAMASALLERPIVIFGEKGTVRDYIHVSDLADGIVRVLDKGTSGEVYNLGSGVGRSNLEIIQTFKPFIEQSGCCVHIEHVEGRSFDVRSNVLCSAKLLRETGWTPQLDFDKGIERFWGWLRQNMPCD